jgi:GNAT acetyltransferase
MHIPDRRLMEIQADTLYTRDPSGCIHRVREPYGGPAPRFFFGRTQQGNIWRFRYDLPERVRDSLERLASDEPVIQDLRAAPQNLAAFVTALGDDPANPHPDSGPAYRFPDVVAPAANATRVAPANVHLIEEMGPDWASFGVELPEREPCWAVVQDGRVVSVCFSARLGDDAAEAGVETLAPYRGRGLACSVVSAWARAVQAMGLIPLYSTSWDNVASQGVARKLGLIQYGVDLSL